MGVQHLLAQQATGAGWLGFAPLTRIFAIFDLLLIMPQQRRQKKWQHMLSELKTGDKVVTSGGIRGTIIAIKDDYLHLRVLFFQAEDGIRDVAVTGVQTCALPI